MRNSLCLTLIFGLASTGLAGFDQDFFNLVNLDHSSMTKVKPLVQAANYDSAFKVYRDTLLLRLRRADMGAFGWHSYQTHPRPLSFAKRLVDSLSESAYVAQSTGVDYMDTQGMSGAPGSIGTIRWATPLRADRKDEYSWYKNFTPLATKYFQTRSKVYLDKYFEITSQFAQNQKSQVLALPSADQKQFNCNYSQDAQTALNQGARIANILRQMAIFSKYLGTSDPSPAWDKALQGYSTSLSHDRMNQINGRSLARIVYSLIVDHPYAMFNRYQYAGAVPNQRFGGLAALMHYPVLFPEMKTVQNDLGPKVEAAMLDYAQGNFFKDGAMLEQSFNYNLGDLSMADDLFNLWKGKTTPPSIIKLQQGKLYFKRLLAASSIPTGSIPRNGNSGWSIPSATWVTNPTDATLRTNALNSFRSSIAPLGEDPVADAISNKLWGAGSDSIPFTSVAFPHMGYYSLRKDWSPTSPFLWMNGARQSRGHDSPDANGIQLHALGRGFLTVAGVQWYSLNLCPAAYQPEFGNYNKYFDEYSSWKANTIVVDDSSQVRGNGVTAYPTYKGGRFFSSNHMDLVESVFDQGYGSIQDVKHFRRIVFLKDQNAWIIHDHLERTSNTQRTYKQLWNFSPEFNSSQVVVDSAHKNIKTVMTSGPNLEMQVFANQSLNFQKFYGTKGSRYLGWHKNDMGSSPVAKNDVHIRFSGSAEMDLVNLIVVRQGTASGIRSQRTISTDSTLGFHVVFTSGDTVIYQGFRDTLRAHVEQKNGTHRKGLSLGTSANKWTFQNQSTTLAFNAYAFEVQDEDWQLTEIQVPNAFSWIENAPVPYPEYRSSAPRVVQSQGTPVALQQGFPYKQSYSDGTQTGSVLKTFDLLGRKNISP